MALRSLLPNGLNVLRASAPRAVPASGLVVARRTATARLAAQPQPTRGQAAPAQRRTLCSATGGNGGAGGKGGSTTATGGPGGEDAGRGLWGTYLQLLDQYPLITRAVTCAVLNGLGDVLSQLLFNAGQPFDVTRCAKFTLLGLVWVGPALFYWYSLLFKLFPEPGLRSTILSLLMDQLLFAPVFIGSIMTLLGLAEGHEPARIKAKLARDLPEAVKANWALWVPAQFINFNFVPPNLRVLATNMTALIWNVYMSYQSHK